MIINDSASIEFSAAFHRVIKDVVIAVVREFIGSEPLEDDLTIIVVKLDKTDG